MGFVRKGSRAREAEAKGLSGAERRDVIKDAYRKS